MFFSCASLGCLDDRNTSQLDILSMANPVNVCHFPLLRVLLPCCCIPLMTHPEYTHNYPVTTQIRPLPCSVAHRNGPVRVPWRNLRHGRRGSKGLESPPPREEHGGRQRRRSRDKVERESDDAMPALHGASPSLRAHPSPWIKRRLPLVSSQNCFV